MAECSPELVWVQENIPPLKNWLEFRSAGLARNSEQPIAIEVCMRANPTWNRAPANNNRASALQRSAFCASLLFYRGNTMRHSFLWLIAVCNATLHADNWHALILRIRITHAHFNGGSKQTIRGWSEVGRVWQTDVNVTVQQLKYGKLAWGILF